LVNRIVVTVDSGSRHCRSITAVSPAGVTRSVTPRSVGEPAAGGLATLAGAPHEDSKPAAAPTISSWRAAHLGFLSRKAATYVVRVSGESGLGHEVRISIVPSATVGSRK
jgi:hypothetical protein